MPSAFKNCFKFVPKLIQNPAKNALNSSQIVPRCVLGGCGQTTLPEHGGELLAWVVLGPSWRVLGPSWRHPEASWGPLGPSWSHLGTILGPSWAVLGPSGRRRGGGGCRRTVRARRDARRQGERNLENLDLLRSARLRPVTGTGGGGFNRSAHSAA